MRRIRVLLRVNQRLLIPRRPLPGDVPHRAAASLPDQSGGPRCNVALNPGADCVSADNAGLLLYRRCRSLF